MSITTDEIRDTVARYLTQHPDETEHLAPLTRSLEHGADLTSRKEFDGGHVTCGAVVIDDTRRLLLIQHKALGRWLLPGGHLEPEDDSLNLAALRELEEETGISWHGTVAPPGQDITPVDIDVHVIPANPAKDEPEHWHADFRWAFWVKEPKVVLQAEEVGGTRGGPGPTRPPRSSRSNSPSCSQRSRSRALSVPLRSARRRTASLPSGGDHNAL